MLTRVKAVDLEQSGKGKQSNDDYVCRACMLRFSGEPETTVNETRMILELL